MKNFISSPMFTLRSLEFLQKVLLPSPQVDSLRKKEPNNCNWNSPLKKPAIFNIDFLVSLLIKHIFLSEFCNDIFL